MLKQCDILRTNLDNTYDFAAVRISGLELQYIKHQTFDLCMVAVTQNGCALQFVNNQTEELCLIAVKQNKYAIKYVDINKFPDVYIYYKLLWS